MKKLEMLLIQGLFVLCMIAMVVCLGSMVLGVRSAESAAATPARTAISAPAPGHSAGVHA